MWANRLPTTDQSANVVKRNYVVCARPIRCLEDFQLGTVQPLPFRLGRCQWNKFDRTVVPVTDRFPSVIHLILETGFLLGFAAAEINPLTGTLTSLGTLSGASGIEGLGFFGNEVFVSVGSSIRVYNHSTLALARVLTGFGDVEAIGADGGTKDEDWFEFNLPTGRMIVVSTSTPGGGNGEFVNVLDPRIELYNSNGVLLASDDNSAPDGRNAQLKRTLPAAGLYRIRVMSGAGVSGEYLLDVDTFLPADFDTDGDVDGADFVAWQTNFPLASGATHAQGDGDGDGDVDGADFVIWQTSFPAPSSPGFGAAARGSGSAYSLPAAAESRSTIARTAANFESKIVVDGKTTSPSSFASINTESQSLVSNRAANAADHIVPTRSKLSPAAVDFWLQTSTMYRSRLTGRIAVVAASVLDGGSKLPLKQCGLTRGKSGTSSFAASRPVLISSSQIDGRPWVNFRTWGKRVTHNVLKACQERAKSRRKVLPDKQYRRRDLNPHLLA